MVTSLALAVSPAVCTDWKQVFRDSIRFANSYTRLPGLISAWEQHCLSGAEREDWLTVLGEEWTGCDNISELKEALQLTPLEDAFEGDEPDLRAAMMTVGEQSALADLPEVVSIYRGCYENNKQGLSWSLREEVAAKFPSLHRYSQPGKPLLISATIPRDDIVALKLCRDEDEIICHLPDIVSVREL